MNLAAAIYNRLTGIEKLAGAAAAAQAVLASTLAQDARTGKPAVYLGNHSDGAQYPCITFRPNAGSPDATLGASMPIDHTTWDIEIWDTSKSATGTMAIENAIAQLLETRCRVAPPLAIDGTVFDVRLFTPLSIIYDDKLHAWCGLLRYEFVVGR